MYIINLCSNKHNKEKLFFLNSFDFHLICKVVFCGYFWISFVFLLYKMHQIFKISSVFKRCPCLELIPGGVRLHLSLPLCIVRAALAARMFGRTRVVSLSHFMAP